MAAETPLAKLMKYLSTEERPVKSGEFQEFWKSLTDEEKDEFKAFIEKL